MHEFNRGYNQDYNNCWRRSYYFDGGQGVWSNWQQMSYKATTLAGYGITDGMGKNVANSVGVPDFLKSNSNTSYLRLAGGDTFNKSATLQLYGGIHTTNAGQFLLNAADSTHSAVLSGSPSGILKWNNKNIVRSINNVAADENGNISINVSGGGGVSTSTANTWTAQQKFHDLMLYQEKYTTYVVTGSDTPNISTMFYTATGAFTLSLGTLAGALRAGQSSVFTAYFTANADYTLTITNAGTIKYIGNASDVAITSEGLLLNILMLKDSDNVTSIVQASKLS